MGVAGDHLFFLLHLAFFTFSLSVSYVSGFFSPCIYFTGSNACPHIGELPFVLFQVFLFISFRQYIYSASFHKTTTCILDSILLTDRCDRFTDLRNGYCVRIFRIHHLSQELSDHKRCIEQLKLSCDYQTHLFFIFCITSRCKMQETVEIYKVQVYNAIILW